MYYRTRIVNFFLILRPIFEKRKMKSEKLKELNIICPQIIIKIFFDNFMFFLLTNNVQQ